MRRDSEVGIATHYVLGVTRIESRWRRDFPHPSTLLLEPTQAPVQWVRKFNLGTERPGREVNQLPTTSAVVKNEWRFTSSPPVCQRGMERTNLYTLSLLKNFLGDTGWYYEKFEDARHLGWESNPGPFKFDWGRNVDHSDRMCGRLTYEVLQVVVRVAIILSMPLRMSWRRSGEQRRRSSQFNLGTW